MVRALSFVWFLFGIFSCQNAKAELSTDQLNNENKHKLVQIKIINRISGSKVTIGSGFYISKNGLLATNYHVVKKAVLYPDDYQVKFIDSMDVEHSAEVANIDVVSDLALLETSTSSTAFFELAGSLPEKGVSILSMGNPSDIGMMVVPGTFNGLRTDTFVQYITFSGAINSGMSGGPTINDHSLVVGVNVRNMPGKQIGFLVPVVKLKRLLDTYQAVSKSANNTSFYPQITEQIVAHQQAFYSDILADDWSSESLGSAIVPQKIQAVLSCWGDSNEKDEKRQYQSVSSGCYAKDSITIDSTGKRNLYAGAFRYRFEWLQSEKLNSWQLSNLYEKRIRASGLKNASNSDVSDYFCDHNLVLNQDKNRLKTTICSRSYRKFPGLYDVAFSAILLGKDDQALIAKFTLNAVTQETGEAFSLKFMEHIKWN